MKVYPAELTDLITSYVLAAQAALEAAGYRAPKLPESITLRWRKATKIVNGKLSFRAAGVWASACHYWLGKRRSLIEYAMDPKTRRVNPSVFGDTRHECCHGVMWANKIGRSYKEQHGIMKTMQGGWY